MINICIFEDQGYQDLLPLTYFKPSYDLLLGMHTLAEKVEKRFGFANVSLHCRPYLKPVVQHRHRGVGVNQVNTGAPCLFINGRVVMTTPLFDVLSRLKSTHNYLFVSQGEFVAAYLKGDLLHYMEEALKAVPHTTDLMTYLRKKCVTKDLKNVHVITKPWDLVRLNADDIRHDFHFVNTPGIIKGNLGSYVSIQNENNVSVGRDAVIEDFVYIDATSGPVYIDEHAHVTAGSRLEGPVYIGKHTQLKQAYVSSSSIGPQCRVGGEVSQSIFYGYSNKAHEGYIGNSYVGEWVNMGAGTITSNLKNTYGEITCKDEETGMQFLGSIVGDHVKLGIGTRLNAGTTLGFGAALFGDTFHDKIVDAFAWGTPGEYSKIEKEKFFDIASRMMSRRKRELLDREKTVLSVLYDESDTEE